MTPTNPKQKEAVPTDEEIYQEFWAEEWPGIECPKDPDWQKDDYCLLIKKARRAGYAEGAREQREKDAKIALAKRVKAWGASQSTSNIMAGFNRACGEIAEAIRARGDKPGEGK